MLTDEQIDQILYEYTRQQDEFNLSVIEIIADRLSRIADFDNLYTLDGLSIISKDISKIHQLHKNYVKKQENRLEDDFWHIVFVIYAEAEQFYINQAALEKNIELVNAVEKAISVAKASLSASLKTPVFLIRDLASPTHRTAYNLEKTYRTVINEAYSYRNVSKELRDVALKRTETQLFDSGIHYLIKNSSDDTESVKNANLAVRFNVLDNVRNLINQVQDIMGKQFKADGFELSAHIFPAPDHAPAQGHQFTKENVDKMQAGLDFEDVTGTKYVGFERNIGEWNCRHYFMAIKLGAEPQYSQKQLDKILEDNERGYTDENGKHRTLYECTQIQRKYEREIRTAKEKYLYSKALNNKQMMAQARNTVGRLTSRYKQFSNACGIPAKLERIRVEGY